MSWHRGHPDDVAIVTSDVALSYAELDSRVDVKIELFRQVGIGAGHRIALYEATSLDYIVSLIALIERGVVVCPMNTRWPEGAVSEAIAGINAVLLQDVLARGHNTQAIDGSPILTDHRWATVVFTSGSSGTPKAAVHSLANHRASAQASNQNIVLAPGDRWLLSLPLYHVGGLGIVFRCLEAGATIALPDAGQGLDEAIATYAPSHVSMVSTQLFRLLQDSSMRQGLSTMKAVLMGGGAIPSHLVQQANLYTIPLHTSYGMTEMSTQITCTRPGADLSTLLSSGEPLLPDSMRLNPLSGEIEVTGPCLFQGYLEGDEVDLPLDVEGYFWTGDMGYVDDHGHLHVSGRLDRMFISGGENIQPAQIEEVLYSVNAVLQAIVFPVEDEEFGHRPVAFVRVEDEFDEVELKKWVGSVVPGYMVPLRILPWSEELDEGMKPTAEKLLRLWSEYNS